jgi:hypothetical protein
MAVSWYIMNTNHDTVSGFETDDFENFAKDGFEEALNSAMAESVEICNYDLSVRTPMRVIMNGKVQDTKLNSISRQMLSPIGSCRAGQYVYYKDRYWIIVGLEDDNGIYEKSVLALCNYYLTWLNDRNQVVQRWANITSASQYNTGETSDEYSHIRSDQLMLIMSNDEESLILPHRKRFVIDKRCKLYEKSFAPDVKVDTSKPIITYFITRTDNILYDYQSSGHAEYMLTQEEQHENDGYYVVDGKGYWLCDIPVEKDNETPTLSCEIVCEEPIIYSGLEPTVFLAKFYDEDGKEIMASPQWSIDCDYSSDLHIEYVDNSISISVNNEKLLNKSFELSLSAFGYETASLNVTIKGFL